MWAIRPQTTWLAKMPTAVGLAAAGDRDRVADEQDTCLASTLPAWP